MTLFPSEMSYLIESLERKPTKTELAMVSAQWSEHCSYKSSRIYIKQLYRKSASSQGGLDSGVLDIGDGYVVTAHIESHNHPSAVEPYGGAATGVGGVLRDIISAGTRPIAVLDGLRFGDISVDRHSAWRLKEAVRGISDYGNCMGIPTVSGETGFDSCYTDYALVDVGAIGLGKKDTIIRNRASPGDNILLIGGLTGHDGVGGAQFASDSLDSHDRDAVQIPDPFIEKITMEAIFEALPHIHAIKDLGGGGLACAISETAHSHNVGMMINADSVHTRESMETHDIMVSESQERMLVITDDAGMGAVNKACSKFRVMCSLIGTVNDSGVITVHDRNGIRANMPASLLAIAPVLKWPASDIPITHESHNDMGPLNDYTDVIYEMLAGMHCSSRHSIYRQYDYEVGVRTMIGPGQDASLLRMDNDMYLAVSMSGNPGHCYSNPYKGAMGCFEEGYRNVTCVGATPVAMLDHLQFGSPEDPKIFRTFTDSVSGLAAYGKGTDIPCIGGKVSLYNETAHGPIKPTPVIMVLGMSKSIPAIWEPKEGDSLVMIGSTKPELGGSIYYSMNNYAGGTCPAVDITESIKNGDTARHMIHDSVASRIHDCSGGGLAVALARLCMGGDIGCSVNLGDMLQESCLTNHMLFSESHCRYLAVIPEKHSTPDVLGRYGLQVLGHFGGDSIVFHSNGIIANVMVDKVKNMWHESLECMMHNG